MPTRPTLLCATVALLAGCESSEPQACTLIGCTSGLSIQLQASSWAAGSWQVRVDTPSGTRTCSIPLPLPANPQPLCTGDMVLGTSGSALPANEHRLTGVSLPDQPSQITVTVSRDGVQLAQQTATPVYKTFQPNGPSCGPACVQAVVDVSW